RRFLRECLPRPIPSSGIQPPWSRSHRSCRSAPALGNAAVSRPSAFPNRRQGVELLLTRATTASEQEMTRQICFAWLSFREASGVGELIILTSERREPGCRQPNRESLPSRASSRLWPAPRATYYEGTDFASEKMRQTWAT